MSSNEKSENTIRMAAAAAGAALAVLGFKKGGVAGATVGIMGASIVATGIAAATGLPVTSNTPREVRETLEVMASPEETFDAWSRFENFPRFMSNVIDVRRTGERTFHWVAEGPLGQRVEWDAELTASQRGKLISWRSTTAEIPNSGEVHFEPTRHGTRVLVVMRYGQTIGPIGALVARITGGDPRSLVRQDLLRFKQLVEA
jgi:uncharacterized membrane protein